MGELIIYMYIGRLRRPSVGPSSTSSQKPPGQSKPNFIWSYGSGNESLFKWSWSHDQDGCHAHIAGMVKTFKNVLRNQLANDLWTLYIASGTRTLQSLFRRWSWVDLDLLYSKVKFAPKCFCMGKCLDTRFYGNYWSLWTESWYKLCPPQPKGKGDILLLVWIPSVSALVIVCTLSPEPIGRFGQTCTDRLLGGRKEVIRFWFLDLIFKVKPALRNWRNKKLVCTLSL